MLEPCDLDRKAVRLQAARRAMQPAERDFIAREVQARMLERMDLVRLEPALILDVGCGRAAGSAALAARYPRALCIALDLSPAALRHGRTEPARAAGAARLAGWLRRAGARVRGASRASPADPGPIGGAPALLAADTHRLPLPDACADLIWSNLAWHQFADPEAVLAEWYRVIRPGGLLMLSAFGVDTLRGLPGLAPGFARFPDMHDIGDALVAAGFAEPVMDVERITLGYQDPRDLIAEWRAALGGNPRADRRRGLGSRAGLAQALAAMAAHRDADGRIPVGLELIHGHAWCPPQKRLPAGLAPVRFINRNAEGPLSRSREE
jgi:malonyl-CoA O-methyltransferase